MARTAACSTVRVAAMKLLLRAAALLVLACTLAGCTPPKFASPKEEATAQHWLAELRARHFDAVNGALDPSLSVDNRAEVFEQMAGAIPAGEPSSVKLVGDQHVTSPAGHVVNLTYEYDYAGRWLLANVAIKTLDGVDTIVGLNVTPIATSLEEQNRFGLADKPAIAYVVLALACLMPLFTIFTLVVCVRTRLRGRKWPWIVAILFGFGSLSVNWTTGAWTFHLLSFQLLGAGVVAAPFGPWVLTAAVPVGALVFLVRRLTLMAPPPTVTAAE